MKRNLRTPGDKIGRLTLIRKFRKNNKTYWECKCDCGNITTKISCYMSKPNRPKSCGCLSSKNTLDKILYKFVFPEPNTGCWLWAGLVDPDGYGRVQVVNKMYRAHRFIYESIKNIKLRSDELLCHTCDTPACVNPDHLFIGTPADNSADMVAKGRQARGERQGNAKLTDDDIYTIKQMKLLDPKITQKDIAKLFDVTATTIGGILREKSWPHIQL